MTSRKKKAAPAPCALPAELTIQHALAVQAQLLQAVAAGCTVFDAGGVESIDSAGVQLLVALERSVGERYALRNPAAPVQQAYLLYGLGVGDCAVQTAA